jgi:hypothetical protein
MRRPRTAQAFADETPKINFKKILEKKPAPDECFSS